MIIKDANYVETFNLNDAWRDVMLLCILKGHDYVVKGITGSYIGQIRRQLTNVMAKIITPGQRPLAPIVPPPHPSPTTDENIEKYFVDYIMGTEVKGKQDYTYGNFINPQLPRVIELLIQSGGNTNQACISVGNESSIFLGDPPCLRTITFKVVEHKLNMSVFFRSWDLMSGWPENLGGMQLLKEYILSEIEDYIDVVDGNLFAHSDGLHIYEQYFDIANELNMNKIEISPGVLEDKDKYEKFLGGK